MTKEELLKPRWKVIADYPGALFEIGYVIAAYENGVAYIVEGDSYSMNDFPALFKKLEWWEERKMEDMPEYIKYVTGTFYKHLYKLENGRMYFNQELHDHWIGWLPIDKTFSLYEPATKEEYESSIKQ